MASLTDKITDTRNAARPNSARVSSGRSAGGATLACDNLVGWPTASKVHFVTYRIDSNSNPVAGTQLDCYGIVSGNNIGSLTVVDGTDAGNAVNDVVEMLPTAGWGQDLSDALTVAHERTGAHKSAATYPAPVFSGTATGTYTLAGTPTLTSPTINTPTIASPTISGTLTGAVVANANLSTASGELGAAWASWTPTWTNLTIGNATVVGKYRQVGKIVLGNLAVIFGSTTSITGSAPTFTLPVTALPSGHVVDQTPIGQGTILDAGTIIFYCSAIYHSTTTAKIFGWQANGVYLSNTDISSTVPMTWTTSDQIFVNFAYEAA